MQTKAFALATALALATSAAFAQYGYDDNIYGRTLRGTWTVGGAAFVDTDTAMGREFQLSLTFGNYIDNGFMVGGYASLLDNEWFNTTTGGATCKWHFWDFGPEQAFSMYLGGDLGLGYLKTGVDSNTALVIGARFGIDFFLTFNVSLGISADVHFATDDIYPGSKNGLTNSDITFRYGVSYYW
ncbi:MAG: hypothetical protein FWG05_00710 [Kiritimatiellaeota bacterium]|nr:hypothetical protein [Kiritimatiellota bacterium]